MTNPLYLVDASIYIFRAYYSLPSTFIAENGEVINAVYGYTGFLLDLLDGEPEYISFAFDESLNTCYRNEIYPEYKANRDLPDKNLEYQLAQCQKITRLLGLHSVCLYNYEADDIIGTLQKKLGGDRSAIIVTRDKDLGQLLRQEDKLWDFAANEFSGPSEVAEKFGVQPEQIADYLALAGDTVDNIPGAPGIGAKSAAQLLQYYGDIDALYARLDEIDQVGMRGAKRAKTTLAEHEATVRMYQEITQIFCDIDIEVSLTDLKRGDASRAELEQFAAEMRFGQRLQDRLLSAATLD